MLAAYHDKSMREIFIEFIQNVLEHYQECIKDHTPNKTTKKALENVKKRKGLQKAKTIEELLKKLGE